MADDPWHPATQAVAAGRPAHESDQPLNAPITMTSTYVAGGELEYGRFGNPTWRAFEETLGALEGGSALAFASGLAACSTIFDLVGTGSKVVATAGAYNGTIGQLADLEARGRLRTELVNMTDLDAVRRSMDDAALLWVESPTNPLLDVADIGGLVELAQEFGARVVVDNTFATPLLQRPLDDGVDLVVHSATKLIAGHSDVLMGAIVTRDQELFSVLKGRRELIGAVPGPFEAWLALRGLRTLDVRLERAQANAVELAKRLANHDRISRVRYPGFGTIISIEVEGGAMAADLLTRRTALWVHATSLGGVESTFERRARWRTESADVPESLVRLSVGIEHVEDLWRDLEGALTHP